MTLADFLDVANENKKVSVFYNTEDEMQYQYDGRNSIPSNDNNVNVNEINICEDGSFIVILDK